MTEKLLVATVGLPRSGKTTWARRQGVPIVNPDSIRLAIHGCRYVEQAEPLVWAIAKTMVRSLFLAGHDVVVLDACNVTRKRRQEWISNEWRTLFKLVDADAEECLYRARRECDQYIVPIIRKQAREFEPLGLDESKLTVSVLDLLQKERSSL
jgi:predicted kinase